jgi:hypothetical protein
MSELIRKSDVLNLLNKTKVASWYDNFAGAVLITIHDAVEDMPPVNAIELPCKIGDEVFEPIMKSGTIYIRTVKGFTVSDRIELINCETKNYYWFEIGKKVFLTREEAEKALEELRNG